MVVREGASEEEKGGKRGFEEERGGPRGGEGCLRRSEMV